MNRRYEEVIKPIADVSEALPAAAKVTAALRLRPEPGTRPVVYISDGSCKLDPAQTQKGASPYRLFDRYKV